MGKAYIFNQHLDKDDRAIIEAALRAAGFDPDYSIPADLSMLDPNADIGVVGLPIGARDVAAVNARIQGFAGEGVRVVAIWLHDKEEGGAGVPEGIGKYGMTVDIDSRALTSTLQGETDTWEEPGGATSAVSPTKRNKC